jgi:hypothetical protein
MDTTGFDPQGRLNELERPLSGLRPVTVGLNRDRMLFDAGRAAARADARGRFLTLAAAALAVVTGLGLSLFIERSRRHSLEVALAGFEHRQQSPPSSSIPPVSIATNDASPYSYRALSLLENSGGLCEFRPPIGALQPDRAPPGAEAERAPLRVRDTEKLLQF